MSFLYHLTQNMNPLKKHIYINRKEEKDSLVQRKHVLLIMEKKERASAFTSKGSLTLEAAIVIPLFFFAILALAYLLEIMAIQNTIRNALCSAGREVAMQVYVGIQPDENQLEQGIIQNIGKDRLERSVVFQGANGIDCGETTYNSRTGVLDLSMKYQVDIPVLMFHLAPIEYEETLRMKGWTGYFTIAETGEEEQMVYITNTGMVYHKDAECTYLDLSVQSIPKENIEDVRNQSGGKYYVCESCGKKQTSCEFRYITAYGTRYHTSLECKKIKRTVHAVAIDEVYGLGGCSKCVK